MSTGALAPGAGRLRGPLKVLQPPLQGLCLEARFERGQDEELAVQTYGKEAELLVVEVAARFQVVDGAPQVIGWQAGSAFRSQLTLRVTVRAWPLAVPVTVNV